MTQTGEVVESKGGTLTVVFERPAACGSCNGCMSRQCTNVEIPGEASVGEWVDVEMPEKNVVGASAIAYLIPLALLIAGLMLGAALHGPLGIGWSKDLFAALCGGVSFGIGLVIVRCADGFLRKKTGWQPRVIAVHAGPENRATVEKAEGEKDDGR